jgi:hypothetical protein
VIRFAKIFTVALFGAFAVVTVVAASPDPGDSKPSYTDELDLTGTPSKVDIEVLASTLEFDLFLKAPEEWGDAYYDDGKFVINTVTRNVEDAAKVLREYGVMGGVIIRQVPTSIADYDRAKDAIRHAKEFEGKLSSVGPDYAAGTLRVKTLPGARVSEIDVQEVLEQAGASSAAKSELDPPLPVVIEEGAAFHLMASRYHDDSPFYGGGFMAFFDDTGDPHNASGCTGAFAWYRAPYYYMVSAAHCARDSNYHHSDDVRRWTTDGHYYSIGTVTYVSAGANGTVSGKHGDWLMARMDNGNATASWVWTGTFDSHTPQRVHIPAVLNAGWSNSTLRTAGAATAQHPTWGDGELNPTKIIATNQDVLQDGVWYTNLTIAEDTDECPYRGDSGGPFYQPRSDGRLHAVGIMSGSQTDVYPCQMSYTPIGYVTADFGGELQTD